MRFSATSSSGISLFCVPLTAAVFVLLLLLLTTVGEFFCCICLLVIEGTDDDSWSFATVAAEAAGGLGDFLKPIWNKKITN